MTWHLDVTALARYASGAAAGAEAASAEAHLLRCDACRSGVATYVDDARLRGVFADVVDVLDAPRPGGVEPQLRAPGVRDETARQLLATPAMRASWLLSVLAALVFAVAAAWSEGNEDLFLAVAPILPVVGVAFAYGRSVDPAYEITVAAPFGGFRLLLLRASAAVAATTVMTLAIGVFLPAGMVGAWLLPALALTTLTLAASTVWDVTRAAAYVGSTWVVAVGLAARWDRDVVGPPTQLVSLLLVAGGIALLAARRDRLEREVDA